MRRLAVLGLFVLAGCSRGAAPPASSAGGQCVDGDATYYADSLAGRPTASGEAYDPGAMTAAARAFPMGSTVRVVWGERAVTVRVNDRGPFRRGGVVDLSRAAAESLGMVRAGRVAVRVCSAG
jgi:rare lipoprotein A